MDYAGAKNSLAVGAVHDTGGHATFTSVGPTGDGRPAPQAVGTGMDIRSARGQGSPGGYDRLSGTSMASPSVAGVAALLMDALPSHRDNPALARARLMASAIRPDARLDDPAAFRLDNTAGPGTIQNVYGMGKVSAHTAVLDGAAQGDDGVGAGDGPVHAAALEAVADDGLAAALEDAGGDAQSAGAERGVVHAFAIDGEVLEFPAHVVVAMDMPAQRRDDRPGAEPVEFVAARLAPLRRQVAVAVDGPGGFEDMLLGMEQTTGAERTVAQSLAHTLQGRHAPGCGP